MILIALAFGWIVGLLLGSGGIAVVVAIGPTALAVALALRFRQTPPILWIALALVAVALGDLRYGAFLGAVRGNDVGAMTDRSVVQLRGVVAGDPTPFGMGEQFPLDVRERESAGAWIASRGTVEVREDDVAPYRVGDRLEVAAVLLQPDPQLPPYLSLLRQDGVVAVASYPTVTPLGDWERTPLTLIARLREDAAVVLSQALPEPEAGLARGITLGEHGTLGPDIAADFSRTNTSHILAVDGYKVGLVATLFDSVLKLVLRPLLSAIGTIGGIALYTAFVGASPSALRAAIMGGIFALGRSLGRPRDTLNALAVAALVLTVLNPFLLWNLAFQLSFATTLGLAVLAPLTESWVPHRFGFLREPLGATLAAEIASAPLVVTAFDQVSLASLPVHAVVMPLLPLAMSLSALTALAGLVVPAAGDVVGLLAWVPLAGIVTVVRWAGGLSIAALAVPRLGLGAIVVAYTVLGLVLFSRPNPFFGAGLPLGDLWRRAIAVVPARLLVPGVAVPVALVGALQLYQASPVDQLRFLNVAGGDAALVQLVGGDNLYVQGQASAAGVAQAADPSLPFWDRSIAVAAVIADGDPALVDLTDLADRLTIHRAVVPAAGYSAVVVQRWQSVVARRHVALTSVNVANRTAGPLVTLGDHATLAIYPVAGEPAKGRTAATPPSLALRLSLRSTAVVWASALPADQARLVASGVPLSAQVLKLVGQSARWGLDPAFFQAVNPRIVILPAGATSRFARPTAGTLDLLANHQVYRNDQDGEITISLEPNGLSVHTSNEQ